MSVVRSASSVRCTLGFELLAPSADPDPVQRHLENQRRAEAFVEILLRRRNADGMAHAPLTEEWVMAVLTLYLFQGTRKPLTRLPSALLPGTDEFAALVRDCSLPEVRYKFRQLEKLSPRGLRAEVGSAARLLDGVFRSPAFAARCSGGFDFGGFLQRRGMLIVERGDDIGDDPMRTVMGAIVLLVIDFAKRRPVPSPPIRVVIAEATNARLLGAPELRGLAETSKNGLFWTLLVQNLDVPGGPEPVLQNCLRHGGRRVSWSASSATPLPGCSRSDAAVAGAAATFDDPVSRGVSDVRDHADRARNRQRHLFAHRQRR